MMILELYPYNEQKHIPRTGWDEFAIKNTLQDGKELFVDQNNEVWTSGKREFVGKVA